MVKLVVSGLGRSNMEGREEHWVGELKLSPFEGFHEHFIRWKLLKI